MRRDPHSYADEAQGVVEHLTWDVEVDFMTRTLRCTAELRVRGAGETLDLDTRDLPIERVDDGGDGDGRSCAWELAAAEPILGARLRVQLPAGTTRVRIRYRTSPTASALQWLTPAQTAGGVHPFLFSQCQAIHARSLVPLQDTPRVRITYDATVLTVPARAARADGGGRGARRDGERARAAGRCRSRFRRTCSRSPSASWRRATSGRARACGPSRRWSRRRRGSSPASTTC